MTKNLFPLNTETICKKCLKVIPAKLVEGNGDIYMEKLCANCGTSKYLHFKDAELYKQLDSFSNYGEKICISPHCAGGSGKCNEHLNKAMHILLNVTNQCNMECSVCLAGSGKDIQDKCEDIDCDTILEKLPYANNKDVHFIPIGGEPTLKDNIFSIITAGIKKGYTVKLATNGLKLVSKGYVERLKTAGLNWVFLHLDSIDDNTNFLLKGKHRMYETYSKIISNLENSGIRCQLGVTVIKDINLHQLDDIIQFAFSKKIFWISLYPCSNISRTETHEKTTYTKDVLNALEISTKSKIKTEDFLASMRLWSFLYRITGRIAFYQKISSLPIILMRVGVNKDEHLDYLPINRLFNLSNILKNPKYFMLLLKLLWNLPKLLNYNKHFCSDDFIFLVIQKLQDIDHIDLREASQNFNVFITKEGYIPIDIYNYLYRFKSCW